MDQVPDGPGDHVSLATEEPLAPLRSAQDVGNIAGDGGLLRKDHETQRTLIGNTRAA
jgi:hypothetical protein